MTLASPFPAARSAAIVKARMTASELIYREPVNEVDRVLLLAVRGGRSADDDRELSHLAESVGLAHVRGAARDNKVAAIVGDALTSVGCALPEAWRDELNRNDIRVRALILTLERCVEALDAAGIRCAVIEGGGTLLSTALPLRAYGAGDFDLLVDHEHFEDALRTLATLDFRAADRRGRPTRRVELRREGVSGTEWIELGSQPFDRMWVPLEIGDRTAAWLDRRVPSRKAPDVCVLAPADALALVATHTSMHSFVRSPGLRLHVDVDRTLRDTKVDVEHAAREIDALGVSTRAFVSLSMAAGLLETPVPAPLLQRLAPSPWRRRALFGLLARERVLVTGRRKLTGAKAVVLDALLDEQGPARWGARLLFPSEAWLREHMPRIVDGDQGILRLHWERYRMLATKWRKEVE